MPRKKVIPNFAGLKLMPEELVFYISKYGYVAILVLIVLQEIGMPSPIPVELVAFVTGYLSYKGLLYLPFVILTAIVADFIGAHILYIVFYTSGIFLLKRKPQWLPISEERIARFKEKIHSGGWKSIFLFRLVSMTRGYSAIISGLLHVNLRLYLPVVLTSALIWTTLYSTLGFVLGPSWNLIINDIDRFKYILYGVFFIIVSVSVFLWLRKKQKIKKRDY